MPERGRRATVPKRCAAAALRRLEHAKTPSSEHKSSTLVARNQHVKTTLRVPVPVRPRFKAWGTNPRYICAACMPSSKTKAEGLPGISCNLQGQRHLQRNNKKSTLYVSVFAGTNCHLRPWIEAPAVDERNTACEKQLQIARAPAYQQRCHRVPSDAVHIV